MRLVPRSTGTTAIWGRRLLAVGAIGLASLPLLALPASATGSPMVGTFTITAGACSGGVASGTYLRMVLSGGSNAAGPFFSNSASSCSDNTYTPLAPGTGGGLVTGSYQSQPSPAFDSSGNALADEITTPVPFEGVKFATATNQVDPQTGLHVPAPTIADNGGALSGNLEAFGVSWNNQQFNQGSPKPDGTAPGNTTPVSGTYDAATGVYVLEWSSQVVGGPFNGFSAFWHLTGRFVPAAGTSAPAPSGAAATSAGGSSGAATAATGAHPSTAASSGAAPTTGASAADPSAAAGSTSTSSTTPGSATASQRAATSTHTALSSRTITTGTHGWHAPTWLVVLVGLLAVLGLGGVLLSERRLRAASTS
jgi:hypothetical protein